MRIRSIKPDFFRHEGVAELSFETRLCFQGLWCLADSEGRLEDRPKRIKADIFPYDDVNMEKMLTDLHNHGFITRYSVDGKAFICMPSWKKHQRINGKEAAVPSTIPAPPEPQPNTASETTEKQERSGGEAPEKHPSNNREASEITGNGNGNGNEETTLRVERPPRTPRAKIPVEDEADPVKIYHKLTGRNPKPAERDAIRAEVSAVDHWREVVTKMVLEKHERVDWALERYRGEYRARGSPAEVDFESPKAPLTLELIAIAEGCTVEEARELWNKKPDDTDSRTAA